MRLQGNNVLIKLDRLPDEINLKSGKKLFLDPSYEPEKNAAVTGSVVAVPAQLMYSPSRTDLLPWKTEMELEIDDKVICYFMSSVNAFNLNKWIKDENGELYILVKYQHIYIARRKMGNIKDVEWMVEAKFPSTNKTSTRFVIQADERYPVDEKGDYYKIIPLNGYCIIEPVRNEEYEELEKKFKKLKLRMPGYLKKKYSVKYGIVKYVAKPNKEYLEVYAHIQDSDDNCDIKAGDKIVMRKSADIPLEYEHHASLEGRKKFFRVQRRYILAIVA